MLKISSKRRRTRREIQAEKEAAAAKEADMQAKMNFFQAAEAKLAQFDAMAADLEKAKALMLELQRQGQVNIDEHGNVSPSKQKPVHGVPSGSQEFQDFGQEGAFGGQQ